MPALALALAFLVSAAGAADPAEELGAVFDSGKAPKGGVGLLSAPPENVPPLPGTDWVPADPGGSTSDNNVSAGDKMSFWERLQTKTFDSLCRQAQIPASFSKRFGDVVEPGAKLHRYLRQLPTGELAIIDEVELRVGAGWLPHRRLDLGPRSADWDLFLGAKLQGNSVVVRKLKTKKSCSELVKLVDFRELKVAFPPTASRIAAMAEGEIWQLPVTFRIGLGGRGGDAFYFPATLSLGAFRESQVTVTLRRIDERTLRFRLRLERATLLDAEGKVNANIPLLALGMPGSESFLLRAVGETVAKGVNEYLAVQLQLGVHQQKGVQHALEFILDPKDAEAMERLAEAIKGDLSMLALLRRAGQGILTGASLDPWELLEASAKDEESALGAAPEFAGQDRYRRVTRPFRLQFPILAQFQRHNSTESDRVSLQDEGGGEYVVYRAERRTRRGFVNLPVLGELFTRDAQKNADVMVHRDPDGKSQGPAIVYVQQEGFLRQDGRDAKAMAERADELMRLAGTRGEGRNEKTRLPVEDFFPDRRCGEEPCGKAPPGAFWRETEYRRGVAALTVVLNEPAVRRIVKAGGKALLEAYANTLSGPARLMAEWLADNARVSGGKVVYDRKAARDAAEDVAGKGGPAKWRLAWDLRRAARELSRVAAGLAAARRAGVEETRAQALSNLLSGAGPGRWAYGDVLKLLIQFANPLDISAEFFVDLVGGDKPERRSRYVLHAEDRQDELLEGATRARSRFRPPTKLSD